ncbi:hypothetical protein V7152_08325, partial [Neobacillus drentensis]|uniref:hypothetical protein n=1 Tax=Neobacillus drentensis TaxID=220684 RepID=UPI0030007967
KKFFKRLKIKAVLKLNVDFTHSVDWSGMRETPAGVRDRGDPTGAKRRGGSPERPRTARAWSGNQQASLTQPL